MRISDLTTEMATKRINLLAGDEEVWIDIRSTNSPEYIKAKNAYLQSAAEYVKAGKKLRETKTIMGHKIVEFTDLHYELLSIWLGSLIAGWSFEDELTLESAALMLLNNPDVRDVVDEEAVKLSSEEDAKKKLRLTARPLS